MQVLSPTVEGLLSNALATYNPLKAHKRGQQVICSKCFKGGGTLVKVDDHYEHQWCKGGKVNVN